MSARQTLLKNGFVTWLAKIFSPTSLVFSTEKAKQILGKNFLSPSQFMRPFGDMKGIPLKFSYGDKYQETILDFKLDFYDSEDFKKKELYEINNYIINCLSKEEIIPNFTKNFIKLNKNNIKEFLAQLYKYSPSYYNEFENYFLNYANFKKLNYMSSHFYIFI